MVKVKSMESLKMKGNMKTRKENMNRKMPMMKSRSRNCRIGCRCPVVDRGHILNLRRKRDC